MAFVHLNNHSEYSLLNGSIRIPALIKKCQEFGMTSVALTDYSNLFGAIEFYLEAKKAKIKPILGSVVFHPSNDQFNLRQHRKGIDHLFQLVLLIQNKTGYQNLCKILTKAYLEGFYYKPRVDSQLLREHSEGLIALSSGWDGAISHYLFDGQNEKAREYLKLYSEIFPGRFYMELQENGIEGQHDLNLRSYELAKEFSIPVVATNNCHYLKREESEAYEVLMCIQTGATLHGSSDHNKFSTDGYYFRSPEEMEKLFDYAPEALAATQAIADTVDFEFDLKTYYFPKFDPPEGKSLDDYLEDMTWEGIKFRWPQILKNQNIALTEEELKSDPEKQKKADELYLKYKARITLELAMIKKMGFSGYFLIVSDFIKYAKGQNIPVGPGRGSAAGSLVAYCVQITDLDPIPYNLLFERFLNPERISMPDVDIDFCMNRREEVLKYVAQKYGNVSQIITYGKMKAKAVLRDVGRVMEIPYEEVDKLAKLIPNTLNITLEQALVEEPRLKELADNNAQVGRLVTVALQLEGLNRHASTHAAGVVISDKPLTEYLPLFKGGNGDIVTQFDMKAVEKIGLIKFDFLGLKTLTVIDDTLKIIRRTHGLELQILEIPVVDEAVYKLLSDGDTSGVFQLESSGMKDLLTRMKPSCFEDLVALVALYRPGPLGSGMVDDFINRKQGKTPILYDLPALKPILEDTYGVIVYQEQVMQISSAMGGYSLGEADILRRAMGKKQADEMAKQKQRFLTGAREKKIDEKIAEKTFDLMAKFAEYGFNKSHSAAYALVSYQTAYLKTHYLVEYMAAVLTSEMMDTDRIQFYIDDCKANGIKILVPNVNESYLGFSVISKNEIRYGLGAVKGIGEGAIEAIVEARQKHGPFTSFFQFCEVIDHHRVNKRVIESLIKCGAFDSLHEERASVFAVIETCVQASQKMQEQERIGQTNLFGMIEGSAKSTVGLTLPQIPEWTDSDKLLFEKEALGFYFSGHPLKPVAAQVAKISTSTIKKCAGLTPQTSVTIAGMIGQIKVITTKKGTRMAFCTFEDLSGSMEVIFFSDVYLKTINALQTDKPVVLTALVERAEEGVKLIARDLILLSEFVNEKTKSVRFKIPTQLLNDKSWSHFQKIISEYEGGTCKGFLHLLKKGESETIMELPKGFKLDESDKLMSRVNSLFKETIVEYDV